MCPGFVLADLAAAEDFQLLWVRCEEEEPTPLVERQDAIPVQDQAPVFPEFLLARPGAEPGVELKAGDSLIAQMEISMAVPDHRGGHITLGPRGPDFLGDESSSFRADAELMRFAAVGGGEDRISEDDRG